jgi:predicted transcriptional regulator
VDRRDILQPFMRRLLTEVFGGRPAAFVQALLSETSVSDADLAEMRRLLAQAKTKARNNKPNAKGD